MDIDTQGFTKEQAEEILAKVRQGIDGLLLRSEVIRGIERIAEASITDNPADLGIVA